MRKTSGSEWHISFVFSDDSLYSWCWAHFEIDGFLRVVLRVQKFKFMPDIWNGPCNTFILRLGLVSLKLLCICINHFREMLLKCRFWNRAWESAFLTSFKRKLILLVYVMRIEKVFYQWLLSCSFTKGGVFNFCFVDSLILANDSKLFSVSGLSTEFVKFYFFFSLPFKECISSNI